MTDKTADKKTQIMRAAMRVVVAYGYKRTSMDDIAKEAQISRPALYQVFRNKEDIYLSCIDLVVEDAFESARLAAQDKADTGARITAYITAYMVFYYRMIIAGPHGPELLDIKARMGGDKFSVAQDRFVAKLNAMAGRPQSDSFGVVLAHAAQGVKISAKSEDELVQHLGVLITKFTA